MTKIPGSVPQNRQDEARRDQRPMAVKAKDHAYADWKKDSACRKAGLGPSDFYYDDSRFVTGEGGERRRQEHIKMLKRTCAFCPVLAQCSELGKDEPFGFLAGKTEEERLSEKNNAKKRAYAERKRNGLTRPQIQARNSENLQT